MSRLRKVALVASAVSILGTAGCAAGAGIGTGGSNSSVGARLRSVVYIDDHTGAAWPVSQATADWDRGLTKVSIRYGACPGSAGASCIHVWQDNQAVQPRRGSKERLAVLNHALLGGPTQVRRAEACWVLGFMLGIPNVDGWHSDPKSCLRNKPLDATTPTTPSASDFTAANANG